MRQRRAMEQPLFLPFLLITSRRDIGLATQQVWHCVDDLIQVPIQKLELQARVEVMLRAREWSRINHSIVVAAGEGILRVEPDGRIAQANPTAYVLLGYPPGGLEGLAVTALLSSPDEQLEAALKAGKAYRQRNSVFRQRDGTPIPVGFVLTPVSPGRASAGTVLIFDDLSELQRLNESLERRVLERTAQLMDANRQLDAFNYSVSHDLRGPLRTVNGFSHALLEDYGHLLDENATVYVQRILAATDRMNTIIDSLLQLSRMTRGDLKRTPFDLSALASTVGSDITLRYPTQPVSFRVSEGLVADADANLVQVLLENLLDNAWKATAHMEAPAVTVGALDSNGQLVFYVQDNGIGFDMQLADKLFKPFEQLHSATEFSGHGIGLAIVQRVVTRHGGRIWAESAPGQGTTFFFTLHD